MKNYPGSTCIGAFTIALYIVLTTSGIASAQASGTWLIKAGYVELRPGVSSDDLSAPSFPGSKIAAENASAPVLSGAYMLNDNVSAELQLGLPFKHDLIGDGAWKGIGKFAKVEQLLPTLSAQYRFLNADSAFRPHAGLGITYAIFRKETGSAVLTALTNTGGPATTLKVDSAWGITPQIGATYAFNANWFADFSVSKTFIKTRMTLSTGQTIDIRLDPVAVSLSIGYRF
jgi:outer membrane protein